MTNGCGALSLCLVSGLLSLRLVAASQPQSGPGQAEGVKIGEITDHSAIIWTRLTAAFAPVSGGPAPVKVGPQTWPTPETITRYDGACPGTAGRIRLRYGPQEDLSKATDTGWTPVSETTDFTHRFQLEDLKPGTDYYFSAEATATNAGSVTSSIRGRFQTAPSPTQPTRVTFTVVTGLMHKHLDDPRGFEIFPSMQRLEPQFVVFTGDSVYYDNDEHPANTPALARWHWERMYSLPRHVELLRSTGSYWEKDDHDTLDDDCWPGKRGKLGGTLTFAEGLRIYRQQTPVSEPPYRTFRWGRDLQIWLTEGREYRSANNLVDGPGKRILGEKQEAWLKKSLLASEATWKVLVSPTPLVGPDRKGKGDNHANTAFRTEGERLRTWFADHLPQRFFTVCGDRHWQYHSVHPESRVQEFSCGPASDIHAGGSPGRDPAYHKFHRVAGGFCSVQVSPTPEGQSEIRFCLHAVDGETLYEWKGVAKGR